jgi:hypothetical protein
MILQRSLRMNTIFPGYLGERNGPTNNSPFDAAVFGAAYLVALLRITLRCLMCDRNARAQHRERHKGRYAHQPLACPFGLRRRFPFRVTAPRHNAALRVAAYGARACVQPPRSRQSAGSWAHQPRPCAERFTRTIVQVARDAGISSLAAAVAVRAQTSLVTLAQSAPIKTGKSSRSSTIATFQDRFVHRGERLLMRN